MEILTSMKVFGVCSIKTIPTSCHEAFEEVGKYEILNPECPVGLFCMRHRLDFRSLYQVNIK